MLVTHFRTETSQRGRRPLGVVSGGRKAAYRTAIDPLELKSLKGGTLCHFMPPSRDTVSTRTFFVSPIPRCRVGSSRATGLCCAKCMRKSAVREAFTLVSSVRSAVRKAAPSRALSEWASQN